jgi:hypothetical protein
MPRASVLGDNAQAPAGPAVHTRRMVTFRREIRLWHETGVTQRAFMIRDDADTCWLACQMQHSRITTPGPAVINDPRSATIQRRIDVDLFVVSLNRLHAVARLDLPTFRFRNGEGAWLAARPSRRAAAVRTCRKAAPVAGDVPAPSDCGRRVQPGGLARRAGRSCPASSMNAGVRPKRMWMPYCSSACCRRRLHSAAL